MTKEENATKLVVVGEQLLDLANALEEQPGLAAEFVQQTPFVKLRDLPDIQGLPTTLPIPISYLMNSTPQPVEHKIATLNPETRSKSSVFLSFWDYHEKYLSGEFTPSQVAVRVLESIKASESHNWIQPVDKEDILRQAAASTERYQNKQHKSQLDGIFMVFKEDQNIQGRVTTAGTSFFNKGKPAVEDSTPIHRLRGAGVIVVGHARMNEIGWDTFSINPNSATPLNPYSLSCSSGGSSGGSAAAVAGGIVPISLGGDGGGSVRIPASFCGLYGLKPTTGRISSFGGAGFSASVGVIGPLATDVDSLSLAFSAICGPDEKDPKTLLQPPFSLQDYDKTDSLEGLTVAVVPEWNKEVDDPVLADHVSSFVNYFKSLGAKVVEIDIKDCHLARAAHGLTISSEMNSWARRFPEHQKDFLPHTRIMMSLVNQTTSTDYVRAQQVRTLMMKQMEDIFKDVDLIVTPVTAMQALDIPEGALTHGLLDSDSTSKCIQFANLANFVGIPAISVPSGFHGDKPVGVQIMAEWYNESLLLRLAKICELKPDVERRKPVVSYSSNHLTPP
ncbi:amidase signature domain-containing protein [Halteromyces radiatus]|uniref:amidase signature domain-containing protein n=1 Tax=Halteromyces radiatus TaxID=101107 RepID=UPI00221F5179|nr:amidase signature domain-containing protein [Halteromyces radiatus]KAI8088980.1 amidase signature domain-containing protein [Halteromyces radiatus]